MTAEEYRLHSRRSFDSFVKTAAAASGEALDSVRNRVGAPASEPTIDDLWYIAELDSCQVGYFWIQLLPEKREAFGFDIYLEETARGRGIGRQLMLEGRKLLHDLDVRRLKVCVFSDNIPARRLYESLGFKEIDFNPEKRQYSLAVDI